MSIRAERKAGELSAKLKKKFASATDKPVSAKQRGLTKKAVLAKAGITENQDHKWGKTRQGCCQDFRARACRTHKKTEAKAQNERPRSGNDVRSLMSSVLSRP
jgi:hypothetical protein